MKNKDFIFVVILFYIGWFGSVLLAKTSFSALSLLFPSLLILVLYFTKNLTKKNMLFAAAIFTIGMIFDFSLIHFGFITAIGHPTLPVPVWLTSIWLIFSFSIIKLGVKINFPLWVNAPLGMVMGPLSYKSGEIFQVLTFQSSFTFLLYAVFWGITFPLILNFSKRFQ